MRQVSARLQQPEGNYWQKGFEEEEEISRWVVVSGLALCYANRPLFDNQSAHAEKGSFCLFLQHCKNCQICFLIKSGKYYINGLLKCPQVLSLKVDFLGGLA